MRSWGFNGVNRVTWFLNDTIHADKNIGEWMDYSKELTENGFVIGYHHYYKPVGDILPSQVFNHQL